MLDIDVLPAQHFDILLELHQLLLVSLFPLPLRWRIQGECHLLGLLIHLGPLQLQSHEELLALLLRQLREALALRHLRLCAARLTTVQQRGI